jgi:polyisoprenoid-binding protein YceI
MRPRGSGMAAGRGMLVPILTSEEAKMSIAVETQTTVERWTADPSRTTVEFEVEHMWGAHAVRGRFRSFEGAYIVGPEGSRIELTIDAASVDTGCPARDKHLRSADFFGADEHPLVRFTSTRITGLENGRVHVRGELEAAGRRVPLAFDGSLRLVEGDLELEAATTVDQSRFGMSDGPFRNVRRPAKLHVKTRLVGSDTRF